MNLLIILTESCILFKQDASVDFVNINNNTVIWGITGHFLHFECVRKYYKGF